MAHLREDGEPVLFVHAVRNGEEITFLQTVEVQRQVARWLNASIGKELVDHTRGAVFDALNGAQVMDRTQNLVGLPGKGAIFQQGSEG